MDAECLYSIFVQESCPITPMQMVPRDRRGRRNLGDRRVTQMCRPGRTPALSRPPPRPLTLSDARAAPPVTTFERGEIVFFTHFPSPLSLSPTHPTSLRVSSVFSPHFCTIPAHFVDTPLLFDKNGGISGSLCSPFAPKPSRNMHNFPLPTFFIECAF